MVEGAKSVRELLTSGFEIERLFLTEDFYAKHTKIIPKGLEITLVTENQFNVKTVQQYNTLRFDVSRKDFL